MRHVVSITLLLVLAACARKTAESEDAAKSPDPNRGDSPRLDKAVASQAQSEEMEMIIREVARDRSQEEQAKIAESQRHYQIALTHFNQGEFEKSKVVAERAIVAWHENIA